MNKETTVSATEALSTITRYPEAGYTLSLQPALDEDREFLRIAENVANAPGKSQKNVSPRRVSRRRRKNKIADSSRRRNRK